MNRVFKISLILALSIAAVFAFIILGPVAIMIVLNLYAGAVMSMISDSEFEEEFARIPEVGFFIEEYPDYSTYHSGDFLGWKAIHYRAEGDGGNALAMYVKKSVLHGGVSGYAGCDEGTGSFTYSVPLEAVIDYLKSGECIR